MTNEDDASKRLLVQVRLRSGKVDEVASWKFVTTFIVLRIHTHITCSHFAFDVYK